MSKLRISRSRSIIFNFRLNVENRLNIFWCLFVCLGLDVWYTTVPPVVKPCGLYDILYIIGIRGSTAQSLIDHTQQGINGRNRIEFISESTCKFPQTKIDPSLFASIQTALFWSLTCAPPSFWGPEPAFMIKIAEKKGRHSIVEAIRFRC